ncbi:hypothetical protein BDY19DRAFT_82367 [Irpex rosettiformis]|uniref:Uncharacterized protein n=1 Tax=Irpex rosettiformis TaxID=378272 RepID=A0ACB8U5U6_9APHY|nr:hypothetical protein BDY19DRAFT_82367 [Irpex rosettiformis]
MTRSCAGKTPVPSVKLVGTSFPASLRDVSVVPETPLADSPTSSDGFRLLHARTREPATPRSDSPMRVSESCSPGGLSGAQPFVSRSTGESTLVDPSQQVMHKAGQPMMDYVQTVDNDANLDSSPLSSPPSPTIPLPPRATVYVDVPPLPAHRKREQARPISTYFVDMPPPLPIKGSNLIKGQHTGAHKRKRTTEVSRSPTTTRSPRAKKPRAHDKLNSPISPLCEIGLESLGHDAHDALKPFCEYVETDIDFDLDTIIEDRFPDPFLLDKLLQPMFRHLYALFSGVEKKAPVPGPARSSKPLIELPRPISRRSPPPLPPLLVRPPISPLKANQNLEYPNIAQTPSKRPFAVNEIHNLDIPSAQLTFPSQQQHLQAIALVRDRDAFLGVQEDPDDDDVVFKSSPMALGGDSSELYGSVEEPSLEPLNLHVENQGSSFSSAPYRSSNFGHEGAVFYSEDGTINPMLLAPPPLPNAVNQFRTPSPSLVPSSPEIPLRYSLSQSTSVVDNEVSSFYESSVSSDDEYDPGLRKSKGKERASDVGILARQTVTEPELPPLWTSVGKRDRRPTAKAMEAMQSVGEDGTRELSMSLFSDAALPSKGPVKARRKGKVERKVGENFEYGFCHQCRGNNGYAKMQCRGMRENGEPCLLLFCEKCVLKRYSTSQLTFDLGATDFVCPKCEGFCNCTTCCKKRGEVYVSTKHVKTGLEIRTQKRARLRQKNDDFDDDYNYRDDERYTEDGGDDDIHITIPGALPVGEQFGAVYDLTGRRRIGVGIVADGPSQQIVLVSTTATTVRRDAQPTIKKKPLKTPRKRQFIGQPKSTWRVVDDADAGDPPVGRAYIGKRGPLFNGAAYKSFDAIMCFEGPLTPDFDEGEDASVNLEDSPSKTLDSALLSFALANLLGGGVSSPVDGDDGGGTSVLEREREPV